MLKEQSKREKSKKKVFVAMSGGVDSSVAALLLKKQGYDVIGVFMKCFNLDGCTERDAEDARRVAEKINIPFYVWDFEKEYKKEVVEYMVKGYKKGITPNPDVMCNREIKFGIFLEKAKSLGADFVATGHYVRLRNTNKYENTKNTKQGSSFHKNFVFCSLNEAKDKNKDQSYFLWTLTQKQLKHCLFPIGDYLKSDVRKIAKKAGLPTAEKKDSQGICFLGKVSLVDFLKKYIPEKRGDILLIKNNDNICCDRKKCYQIKNKENIIKYKKIGEHKGAHFYTIGQRHGLGIGGSKKPYYIVEKNVKKNIIEVAEGDDNPVLYKKEIELIDVNFINAVHSHILKNVGMNVLVRARYRQALVPAVFIIHNSKFIIQFDQPVKFIAPGQSAVFYNKKGEMLGGGVISNF
ncbi:tRNA 2-thiouridine(34) synthase MnmA [Candidatus Wolfebacteria bacterium]|nr:tRNA 2-thiouridine(34) synthase MnmA [Candidatus Wolfebacteria bacterium]